MNAAMEPLVFLLFISICFGMKVDDHQALAKIAIHRATLQLESDTSISASPELLGIQGEHADVVKVVFRRPLGAAATDWIGVFSPANFSSSICASPSNAAPMLCTAPIKYQYANFSSSNYVSDGKGSLTFRIINQRHDFSFALFSGDFQNPVLVAVSNTVAFDQPKAPAYPRLAQGRKWNEMTVTWTSGYSNQEATPFIIWGMVEQHKKKFSSATSLTFTKQDMCGAPANTVGWRDPGYIHSSSLKDLWPNTMYFYKVAHKLLNGSIIFGEENQFKSPPAVGENSLQRVVIVGDMGKGERDGSNEYNNYQPGALNTTDRLVEDLENIDIVFHIGDIVYSNGYLSQWDQFTEQVSEISSRVPYMVASGNHERDWPNSGSFYNVTDSGGECGVPAQTIYNMPATNRADFWYAADYGMFHFCVVNTELDWREGTKQYAFIENCLASVDRQKQPWLIFIAHRVLGYSSAFWYASQGTFAEPMSRDVLQKLWQKYKVDLAFYGHAHNYERTCPVYESICVSQEKQHYSGTFNATIHLVVGGGGAALVKFSPMRPIWSTFQDSDYGFTKLTAYNHSSLLLEYKRSSDGSVYDSLSITREYKDVLGCDTIRNCPEVTLAS